mgnify:CR=1 FL=1
MIFVLKKLLKLIKKNAGIAFLFLLLIVSVTSTTFYNNKKIAIEESYKDLVNNIYFHKSINHIFNNLTPRYKNIDHKISRNETFDKILKKYSI